MRLGESSDATTGGGGNVDGSPSPSLDSPYWGFYDLVAAAQVQAWAPQEPARILDLSGRPEFAVQLAQLGHEVVQVARSPARTPRVATFDADPRALGWLRDESVDAVLAESRMLSMCLAAELTAEQLLRVLRPGGRLLLVVESLLLGLARLADQGRWAELADVPAADVVLVPGDDGAITRCFWPDELRTLLTTVGFEIDWIRPRTLLAPAAVERALAEGGQTALADLVRTELDLAQRREGESAGIHLVASARRPG